VIIGLSGYAQSGKDTVGAYLVEQHGFKRLAFADALRDVLYDLNPMLGLYDGEDASGRAIYRPVSLARTVDRMGWEWTKKSGGRELLQRLGNAVREHVSETAWLDAVFNKMVVGQDYVITDVRFPNEATDIVMHGDGYVWRVVRPGTVAVNQHVSETALDDYVFDAAVENIGSLADLYSEVEQALGLL
jgi:cytidylate kinase